MCPAEEVARPHERSASARTKRWRATTPSTTWLGLGQRFRLGLLLRLRLGLVLALGLGSEFG